MRRALRWTGRIAAAALALLALVAGTTCTLLRTEWGGDQARRLALGRLNAALAGSVALERLRVEDRRLILEGASLRDPDGELIARARRIEITYAPLALLRRRIEIDVLAVDRPELRVVKDAGGTNLARALARRRPQADAARAAGTNAAGGGLDLDLRKLTVAGGSVDVRSVAPEGTRHARHARLSGLRVVGHAAYGTASAALDAAVAVDFDGGRIEASGEVDVARLRARGAGVSVRGRGLDLARVLDGAPPSDLAFELDLQGGGRDLASLDGAVRLVVPAGRLDDHVLGPVRLTAHALGGRCELADLRAVLPGVEITGTGSATVDAVDVRLRVEATDLAATARSLAPPNGPPPLRLAGRGRLDVALTGAPRAPALRVAGRFPALRVDDDQVAGLTLAATVPDLRRPDEADVDAGATAASFGGRALRGITVRARAASPRLTLAAAITGPYPLSFAAAGRRVADGRRADAGGRESARSFTVDALTLRYPEAAWNLARPMRVQVDGRGGLAVDGLALRAGGQSIEADLARDERGLRGHVTVAALDLARLPRALVPPALGLGGVVSAEVRLAGASADPHLSARITLAEGKLHGYRDLRLTLDARYAGARARGRLMARGLGTALDARFDVPTTWPPHDRRAPLRFDLALAETDLGALSKALASATGRPSPVRMQGRAKITVRAGGTARAPALSVDVDTRGLSVDGETVGDARLSLEAAGDGPSRVRLEITPATAGSGTPGHAPAHTLVTVKTPLSLADLRRRPPTAAQLLRTPVEITGDVERLPLAALARLAQVPSPVGGALSSHVALAGTAIAPLGSLTVDVDGVTSGRFPPTDARVELDLGRGSVDARARLTRQRHPLLALVAHVGAPPAALRDPARLLDAPLSLRAVVGPLAMHHLGLAPESDRDPPRVLKGLLHADVTVDGSLRAPRAVAHADVSDVRLDRALLGVGHVEVRYADRQAEVDARLTSANGGRLLAHAVAGADLGYPAVMRLDARRLPLDVRVDADRFDVQGLSGATEGLRTVGGLLTGAVTVRGTTADPRPSGRLELRDGALAITGVGEYRRIHLAVRGDEHNLTVEDLSLESGNGRARLTGTAEHAAGGGYALAARAGLKGFPVYQEGQPLAAVSLDADVKGTVAPFSTRASIDVHDARIELPDAKRRDLQPLASPGDVVLFDSGAPLNRAQAERLRTLVDRQRRKGGGGGGPTAPAPEPPAHVVRLAVNAPRKLWVTGKDTYLELGLGPGFHVSMTDRTRVFGQLIVQRGRIDLFGRRFDLKAGSTLQFDGPPERPELDVSAQYVNEKENVTVLWTAKGPLDHLSIAVSSPNHPELTESQLYTLVITGRLQLGGGTSGAATPSAEAASLLGGLVAARLQKTLARRLPLDVLTIDAGGGAGLSGTQLEAGRYVTDQVYVGYVGRIGADPTRYQNRNAVHVEYQLTSRWGIDGEYGDVGTGSLDLMWKRSY